MENNNLEQQLTALTRKVRKLSREVEKQRKQLGFCIAIACIGISFNVYGEEAFNRPEIKALIEQVSVVLISGSGGFAGAAILSSKSEEDEDEI